MTPSSGCHPISHTVFSGLRTRGRGPSWRLTLAGRGAAVRSGPEHRLAPTLPLFPVCLDRPPGRAAGLLCLCFSVCRTGALSAPASLGAQRPLSGPTCSPVCSPRLSGAWRNSRVHGTQKTIWRRAEEGWHCVYGLSLPQKVSPAG